MKSIVILSLLVFSYSNYCSMETCRRCCQVTPTGCIDAMDYNIRVILNNTGKVHIIHVILPRLRM